MKERWEEKTIGSLCTEMYRGSGITREQIRPNGIPCVRYGEIYTTYNYWFNECLSHTDEQLIKSKKFFEYGDILFAITGESVEDIGKSVAYLGHEKCLAGGDIIVMKHKQDPKFLAYALSSPNAVAQKGFGKTKLKVVHTNASSLKSIIIHIPSLPVQQSIVAYLDAEFAKIEALKANAEKQLQAANDLFQAALKELMTPKKGWEEKSLESLNTEMYRGSGITREQIKAKGIQCVRYGEIYTTYNYWFDECVSHTDEQLITQKKYFEYGDILFAITGESVEDIGKSIAYLGHHKCLAGSDIIVMKHNQNPKYLAYALATPNAIAQKGLGKTKLKVVHTNTSSLKSIVVPIPSLSEQQQIADKLDALRANVKALQKNYTEAITLCNDLKQALLKKVFE